MRLNYNLFLRPQRKLRPWGHRPGKIKEDAHIWHQLKKNEDQGSCPHGVWPSRILFIRVSPTYISKQSTYGAVVPHLRVRTLMTGLTINLGGSQEDQAMVRVVSTTICDDDSCFLNITLHLQASKYYSNKTKKRKSLWSQPAITHLLIRISHQCFRCVSTIDSQTSWSVQDSVTSSNTLSVWSIFFFAWRFVQSKKKSVGEVCVYLNLKSIMFWV